MNTTINNNIQSETTNNIENNIKIHNQNNTSNNSIYTDNKINKNEHITNELDKILQYHISENNVFESLAYRKAIAVIKNTNEKITSRDQLKNLKSLGKSISTKVKEIIKTGELKAASYLSNEKTESLKILTSVYGIGKKHAESFFEKGIKTIDDLKNNDHLLTSVQKIGIKYFDDLQLRIPRSEVEEVLHIVKNELYKLISEINVMIEVCGSYRRGFSTCGDIDILISRKDNFQITGILQNLIELLMQRALIIELLTLSEESFMGIYKIKDSPVRRIDIKIYNKNEYPFALLYFTGSAIFNRNMRLAASKQGYQLTDSNLKERNSNKCISCESEQDIFKALNMEYKSPEEREL